MKIKILTILLLSQFFSFSTWALDPEILPMFNSSGKSSPNSYAILGLGYMKNSVPLDLAKMYQYFTKVMGIPDDVNNNDVNDNIQVCSPKALDLDCDGLNDIDLPTGKNNLIKAINNVNSRIRENDEFYLFLAGHEMNGCTNIGENIQASQWVEMLKDLKCKRINIWLMGYFSGSLVSTLTKLATQHGKELTVITNLNATLIPIRAYSGDMFWDYMLAALAGEYKIEYGQAKNLECDFDDDKKVSLEEAFANGCNHGAGYPQFWSTTTDYRNCTDDYEKGIVNLPSRTVTNNKKEGSLYLLTSEEKIQSGTIEYVAGKRIKLKKGFKTSANARLKAYIFKCSWEYGNNRLRSFSIDEGEEIGKEIDDLRNTSLITLSPNPTTSEFTIFFGEEAEVGNAVVITDLTGKVIYTAENLGSDVSINLGNKSKGVYIVKAISNGNIYTEKLILK